MQGQTKKKVAYLTIDDGPSIHRGRLLSKLKTEGIPAVFFSEGRYLEKYPELGIQTIQDGFILGNHAYDHPHFSSISLADCCKQIERTDQIIEALYQQTGIKRPLKLFRFPYGDKGDGAYGFVFKPWIGRDHKRYVYIQDFLGALGYEQPQLDGIKHRKFLGAGLANDRDMHWTFDVMEWALGPNQSIRGLHNLDQVMARLRKSRPSDIRGPLFFQRRWLDDPVGSEIILMHDQEALVVHFDKIIDQLKQLNLEFKAIV